MAGCWAKAPKMRGTFGEKLQDIVAILPALSTDPITSDLFAAPPKQPERDTNAYDSLTMPDKTFDRDSAGESDDEKEPGAPAAPSPYTPFDAGYKLVALPPSPYYSLPQGWCPS